MIDPDAPEPPRRTYGLKRVDPLANAPADAPPPPPLSTEELARIATTNQPPLSPQAPAAGEKVDDPNDVFALRRELRAREIADHQDDIEIKQRTSRRKRDYWLVMFLLNGGLGSALVLGFTQSNVIMMLYALAGMVLGSIALTWIMWFIMSDY